jgi:hypothetical protein
MRRDGAGTGWIRSAMRAEPLQARAVVLADWAGAPRALREPDGTVPHSRRVPLRAPLPVCARSHHALSIPESPTARRPHQPRPPVRNRHHSASRLNRRALPITETELSVMAALAMMGLKSNPNVGYNTPAATGTPSTL